MPKSSSINNHVDYINGDAKVRAAEAEYERVSGFSHNRERAESRDVKNIVALGVTLISPIIGFVIMIIGSPTFIDPKKTKVAEARESYQNAVRARFKTLSKLAQSESATMPLDETTYAKTINALADSSKLKPKASSGTIAVAATIMGGVIAAAGLGLLAIGAATGTLATFMGAYIAFVGITNRIGFARNRHKDHPLQTIIAEERARLIDLKANPPPVAKPVVKTKKAKDQPVQDLRADSARDNGADSAQDNSADSAQSNTPAPVINTAAPKVAETAPILPPARPLTTRVGRGVGEVPQV